MQKLVIIPTYNEKENIASIIETVVGLAAEYHVLVIDDGSPDGTAEIVEGLMTKHLGRIFIEKRAGKMGLGNAYIHGFLWALKRNYDLIFEMDADFSHSPY
ncbi:MAG: glycosyltransferase, partial [Sediminibacterium sp.]